MGTFGVRDQGRAGSGRLSRSLVGLLCAMAMLLTGMLVTGTASAAEAAADASGDVTLDWNWGGHTPDEAEGVDPVLKGTRDGDAWVPDLGSANGRQLQLFSDSVANMNGEFFGINGWNSKPDGSGDWYDFRTCFTGPCTNGQYWELSDPPTTKDGKVKYPADGKLYLQHTEWNNFDADPTPQLYYAKNMAELGGLKIHANGWKGAQFQPDLSVSAGNTPYINSFSWLNGGFRVSADGTAVFDFSKLMSKYPVLRASAEKAFEDPRVQYLTLNSGNSLEPFAVIKLRESADPKLNTADSPRFGSNIPNDDYVRYGDQYDPLYGKRITAKDVSGQDLTAGIKVDNPVDTKKCGYYWVTYTVEDAKGNKASMIRKVTVQPGTPKFSDLTEANHRTDLVSVDHVNSSNDLFDVNVGKEYAGQIVDVRDASQEDAEHDSFDGHYSQTLVPDDGVLKNMSIGSRGMVYVVVVPWSDPSKLVWDTLTSGVNSDRTFPEIRGAYDVTVDLDSVFDPREGVSAWDQEQGDLTSKITITDPKGQTVSSFDTSREGLYELNYHVSDGQNDTRWSRVVNVVFWQVGVRFVSGVFPQGGQRVSRGVCGIGRCLPVLFCCWLVIWS